MCCHQLVVLLTLKSIFVSLAISSIASLAIFMQINAYENLWRNRLM